MPMHDVDRARRWVLAPQHIDGRRQGYRLPSVRQQQRQQQPLLRRPDWNLDPVAPDTRRTQHAEVQGILRDEQADHSEIHGM